MTNLGKPLAVFVGLGYCSTRFDHELRLITDGTYAYAYGTRSGSTDCPTVCRDHNEVVVNCGQPTPHDGDPCEGEARFLLSDDDCWESVTSIDGEEAADLLTKHGNRIES